MKPLRLSALLLLGAMAAIPASGQSLPLQQLQSAPLNYQSVRGVPLSSTNGNPVGSDGRAPGPASGLNATPFQFQNHLHFGGVVRPATVANLDTSKSLAANAAAIDLPRGGNLVLLRARIGNIMASRTVSFTFGEPITPPEKDEYGIELSIPNPAKGRNAAVNPSDYWWREPYSVNSHSNSTYYYSPHAERVYASEIGNGEVVWQRSEPSSLLSGSVSGAGIAFSRGANRVVLTNRYVVAGAPFKTPRRMYWTEGSFRSTGKPITVSPAQVPDIVFVYNSNVPRSTNEVIFDGQPAASSPTTNTLWFESAINQIKAYNVEGKILVELLGDLRPEAGTGIREQLGYEIVEIAQRPPIDADLVTELGEAIQAFAGPAPDGTPELRPEPIRSTLDRIFDYQHNVPGTTLFDYYAVRETEDENDYVAHWTEGSIAGLRWPYRYVRYKFVWPSDIAKYSHYLRPSAADANQAKATAVPLPSDNAPFIAYQDALDQPRGGLTENFAYYSWLTPEYPAHRALLRFNSAGYVRFERVFSWLDAGLRTGLNVLSSALTNDFSTAAGGTAYGNSYVSGGVLHVVDGVSAQSGNYVVGDFTSGRLVESFRVRFKVRVGDFNIPPADGFGFSFGTIPDANYPPYPQYLADEGTTNGIAVNFDLWDNSEIGNDWAPGIVVRTNGVNAVGVAIAESILYNIDPDTNLQSAPSDPATGLPLRLTTGNQFVPVEIQLYRDGTLDVSYNGVKVLDRVLTGYRPRTGRFGFSGRTGGGNVATAWIDDLQIEVNPNLISADLSFATSVATNLSAWSSGNSFEVPAPALAPRIVNLTAFVGDRLSAPEGEIGGGFDTNYLAGYVRATEGDWFLPDAYLDPLTAGFDLASQGAIIPVNAVPGRNQMEVWWFRRKQVDITRGFKPVLWPAVIARYTLTWPDNASEIVLASNDGSGPLSSLQAKGTIYYQNSTNLPGYNPNEEHALMQGGQAYALRDDLNITATEGYSSAPYVLLRYTAEDNRPAIRPFKVRREKPEAGITFEYNKPAGSILQPPMPLPLLGAPFAPKIPGQPLASLNKEITHWEVRETVHGGASLPAAWRVDAGVRAGLPAFQALALVDINSPAGTLRWLYGTNASENRLEGTISTNRPFVTRSRAQGATPNLWRVEASPEVFSSFAGWVNRNVLVAIAGPNGPASWLARVSFLVPSNNLVPALIELDFTQNAPATAFTQASLIELIQPVAGLATGAFERWRVQWNEPLIGTSSSLRDRYAKATLNDRKGNVWIYRGPHFADRPETFAMRYYYRTLPGFYFPSRTADQQPPVGTITPYLRPRATAGGFIGEEVFGNADGDQAGDDNALLVRYHPVWPETTPVLQMAETLLTPKRGLPAVRGQSSLEVLYQQSQVITNTSLQLTMAEQRVSVALHDPTREKTVEFDQNEIPGSVKTEVSRGRIFFPNLPPHLVKRFFLDPNRGANGMLVLAGEFVDAPLGDKYILLNVAGEKDFDTLRNLCLDSDQKRPFWDQAIVNLATTVEKFVENPGRPGTYEPQSPGRSFRIAELAQIVDDDEAVDSYALTAVGPDSGYVSLIAGNGEAFTPEGDPVSVHVIRVSPTLYRGEVNVLESENPLNERLTLQQVVDLAGRSSEYKFEWRITAPVDGQPPAIYGKLPIRLPTGAWSHLRQVNAGESVATLATIAPDRFASDVSTAPPSVVMPVSQYYFDIVTNREDYLAFTLNSVSLPHRLAIGDRLTLSTEGGAETQARVHSLENDNVVIVSIDGGQEFVVDAGSVFRLAEQLNPGTQSILSTRFVSPGDRNFSELWLGVQLGSGLGARLYLNGGLVANLGLPSDNTPTQNPPSDLLTPRLSRYYRLPAALLSGGAEGPNGDRTNTLTFELVSSAAPGAGLDIGVRLEAYEVEDFVAADPTVWLPLADEQFADGVRAIIGGTADVRSLSDNYLTMRYAPSERARDTNAWSQWTEPQLAEGWIKRVLKGINPFNQRVTDLYNNAVNTEVSIVAQAGQRWEGDIALNLDTINSYGLIEIYETVLNRGKMISIGGGINYGPANDALLLAAGYINDLYNLVGNEAAADASNPTIGIGTKDNTYGDIATALFAFKGQLPSLLEEELALLRGRDDFLVPGVETRPVYNRMVWNYTRGIDAGEVIYALNYNVLDQNTDGKVDADDARRLYPQGHGDAYGHYLTALKGYYQLFLDPNFDWVPRSEAVLVLGKPVSVDYQDERKWAASSSALARTGRQIFDLTWRQGFESGAGRGWSHLRSNRSSSKRTRFWGADHWAARTAQGAYFNWVVGNAIIPETDPDPSHLNTIQQVDRTTVPELQELPAIATELQTAMDQAEGGLTPVGLPEDTVPFDLNPLAIGNGPNTHFEQIYTRAIGALNNAVAAFDDAKDVTRLMRSEEDSLAEFRTQVNEQELAYTNRLIQIYGTPYPEDIGPGKTYRTGFVGPDTIHYMYIDNVELTFRDAFGNPLLVPSEDKEWVIDTQTFVSGWLDEDGISDFTFVRPAFANPVDSTGQTEEYLAGTTNYITYTLSSHGYFKKPASWVGKRSSPGEIQQAIANVAKARNAAFSAFYWADAAKYDLDWAIQSFNQKKDSHKKIREWESAVVSLEQISATAEAAYEIADRYLEETTDQIEEVSNVALEALPKSVILGLASGGDIFGPARSLLKGTGISVKSVTEWSRVIGFSVVRALELANETAVRFIEFDQIQPEQWNQELRESVSEIRDKVYGMNNQFMTINERLQELDDAQRALRALIAEGERIQAEREIFRRRTASVVQGYRSRDAAFRIFRNEKLERYKSLFDLAARYTYMAAKAYDYDTGLLGTTQGRSFINRIVNARALGVIANGQPQFAGSNTGDPGLSSVLAEMYGDWSVVRSRLGFNNPDAYGTTTSLRYENYRITTNETTWQTVLAQARRDNLLDDPDVRRYCLQIESQNGAPVPGFVFEFSTTIADGLNLFGRPLAPYDHAFSPSSFATKIYAVGIAFPGYVGMDDPNSASDAIDDGGGQSPPDPNLAFLNPDALAANPYVYMIPVGTDSMRSPALGDTGTIRTWNVQDVTVPLPFNIGGSDFSTKALWQSEDSLTEPLFNVRKHQAFRPISDPTLFEDNTIYSTGGEFWRNKFTSTRLIGRSVWNSKWKIVVPARTLLTDPVEGMERFQRTVKDVRIYFQTYSYSGN